MARSYGPQSNPGMMVPTTNVWDVSQIYNLQDISPELRELFVRLYQNLNKMALAVNLKKDQNCLFTYHNILPKGGLENNQELICCRDKHLDIFKAVASIENLFNRAKAQNILQKADRFFSSQCILGTFNFWNKYSGFQKYLYDINYLDRTASDELMFNLYIALMKPELLEINYD